MEKEMSVQAVIDDIRHMISQDKKLIKKIGIFGSLARGDYNHESDIDLLVEYNMPPVFIMPSFTAYCALCESLAQTLTETYKRSVDIVHFENDSLSNLFDETVENEVIWI